MRFRLFPCLAALLLFLSPAATGWSRTVTCAADIAKASVLMETNVAYRVTATVTCILQNAILGITDESGVATLTDFHHNRFDGIRAGDRITASGFTKISTNSLIPTAYCEKISVLSHGTPPKPIDVTADDFHSGRFDHAYIRIRGVVRVVFLDEIDPSWIYIVIGSGRGSVSTALNISQTDRSDLTDIEGSEVAISGICRRLRGERRSGSRHMLRRILGIPNMAGIEMLHPPPNDPFDAPGIESTRNMSPEELSATGMRSACGKVLAVWSPNHLLLTTPQGGVLRCDIKGGVMPKCDESVDVAGLPTTDLFRINLARAIWRKSAKTAKPSAEKPERITAEQLFTDENGKPMIQTKYHGRRITVSGIVRSMPTEGSPEGRIYLESGRFTLPIDVSTVPGVLKTLSLGCEIAVTGICVTETDAWSPYASFPHIRDVFLVPQTETGIAILRQPSWWTPQRLLAAIAALLALMLGTLVWNISLHRLAERRGKELAEESIARAETDMKVLERTRLAVELHDSVAQNLTGVAMELEAARQYQNGAPTELLNHMGIAWRTLKSCRDELRNCLWDLRNNALEETDMESAIRKTLLPHVKGVDLAIRFKVPRQMLSDNTTHAMLRIIRELALNGIRHGGAKTIRIAGGIDGNTLEFSVRDDGCGFDPENCPGVDDGHFGLQGIRERVAQFGGTMSVSSEPGKGTKTTITIDSHEKDHGTDS